MVKESIILFDKLIVKVVNGKNKPLKISSAKKNNFEKEFLSQGWFNGNILVCNASKVKEDTLTMYCSSEKFFNIVIKRRTSKEHPKLIGLNAILEVGDFIVLKKRGPDVYDFRGYWDFPAGLAVSDVSFKERLLDRIEKDTKINRNSIFLEEEVHLVAVITPSINLFFKAKCDMDEKQIKDFFEKNFKENERPILLKKSDIPKFLKSNPMVIYPEILKLCYYPTEI